LETPGTVYLVHFSSLSVTLTTQGTLKHVLPLLVIWGVTKCGDKLNKLEEYKNGCCLRSSDHSKPESDKAAEVEELLTVPTMLVRV
jgi:hypothetical protein